MVWSKIEQVSDVSEIQHPAIRHALLIEGQRNIELHHTGDLPARSGLGSSSAFSVGILNALRTLAEKKTDRTSLAKRAIYLERTVLKEAGGIQDQIASAFGGLNFVEIKTDGSFKVDPIHLDQHQLDCFERSLLLVFTGIFRNSHSVADNQTKAIDRNQPHLLKILEYTKQARRILSQRDFIKDFGLLLNETWIEKKMMGPQITNNVIDEIYNAAIDAGGSRWQTVGRRRVWWFYDFRC